MYIKGEIGECVLIKATIEKVEVTGKEEIRYGVKVLDGNDTMNYLDQSEIMFKEDFPENTEPADPSGEFEPLPVEYNDDIIPDSASGLPVDDEWSRPAAKKRGRPRKATVEDLISKAKGFNNVMFCIYDLSKKCDGRKYSSCVYCILDKIRAEIFTEVINYSGTGEEVIQAYADGLKKGLDIIDKYKPESGVKE